VSATAYEARHIRAHGTRDPRAHDDDGTKVELSQKPGFMHVPSMETKTIALELDAYEKLLQAKRPGDSFSAVVRRIRLEDAPPTGADLLTYLATGGSGVSEEYLDAAEEAGRLDRHQ
jgi:hypothetical protein